MITGGDLRQSRLDVGYKTFTISPCPELRADIQRLATEVLSYEQSSIMLLSEMKNNIADQLAELAKANKADLAYRNVNSK